MSVEKASVSIKLIVYVHADGKSESELLSESNGPALSPGDKKVMQKLKKIKMMDEK